MTLFPKNLLNRLILIIASLIIVSQLITIKVFDYFEMEPRAESMAQEISTIVKYTKAAIQSAYPSTRLDLLQSLSKMSDVKIVPAYYFENIKPLPDEIFLSMVVKKIKQDLGEDTIVTLNHYDIPGIWVSFEIGDGLFWAVIPRNVFDRPFPWHWIGWGIVVFLVSISGAYFLTTRINKPLNLLINATSKLKKGLPFKKIPEDTATEFKEVTKAFNEMASNLAKSENERRFIMGSVSHDIRTPLTRMKLSLEMLPKKSAFLKESMDQDIDEINQIINQFLDFVRGFDDEPISSLNFGNFLTELKKQHAILGHDLKISKITRSKDIPKNLFIDVRPLAFKRLFDNLINNGVKFSKSNKIELVAKLYDEKIEINVLDNGPGIPKAQREKLLEPFERLDQARGSIGGSGLGLAIANRIVMVHNGKLELINRRTGGLNVKLTFPLIKAN
ncbi:MAG: ATP-binding protein [Methylophilaceae bacterium]|jgi:two-component system osmolarity sensor histidine kinase EnvZ